MPVLSEGEPAPLFELPDQRGHPISLADFRGRWVVLYFYPKDNTPGCTTEATGFTAAKRRFSARGAVILGVSADSVDSHQSFCDKQNLTITLLSDADGAVLDRYGVWQLKKKFGKEHYGTVRTTYLIDPEGFIRAVWPRVNVKGHIDDVLETLGQIKT